MVNSDVQAVISTLAYFDIFDYPLTVEELEKYLSVHLSKNALASVLKSKKIEKAGRFFVLAGRKNITYLRQRREKISEAKLRQAYRVLCFVQYIPTIVYIGISGSLALKNAKESDDIDLFIITKPHTLWLSRLIVNTFLLTTGRLRLYGKKHTKDTICTNMWIDTAHLKFSATRQHAYTAHEIVQLLPIMNKHHTYEQFVQENKWILKFLPNTVIEESNQQKLSTSTTVAFLDMVAKKLQVWYMRKRITSETISDGAVAFHPHDYTQKILDAWKKRQNI